MSIVFPRTVHVIDYNLRDFATSELDAIWYTSTKTSGCPWHTSSKRCASRISSSKLTTQIVPFVYNFGMLISEPYTYNGNVPHFDFVLYCLMVIWRTDCQMNSSNYSWYPCLLDPNEQTRFFQFLVPQPTSCDHLPVHRIEHFQYNTEGHNCGFLQEPMIFENSMAIFGNSMANPRVSGIGICSLTNEKILFWCNILYWERIPDLAIECWSDTYTGLCYQEWP